MGWIDDLAQHAEAHLDDRVRGELTMRGVSDAQIQSFQMGYLNGLPKGITYPESFLNWSHRGRKLLDVIVLPLTNTLGALRGLQFRHVERERRGYLDYIEEDAKFEAVLFGLGQAMPHLWKSSGVFLVEGAFDLFPIQRFYPGTVATLTARVVLPLVKVLRRVVTDVWVGFDSDATGRAATSKFTKEQGQNFKIHDVRYPTPKLPSGKAAKDPSEIWEAWGDIKFGRFIQSVTAD